MCEPLDLRVFLSGAPRALGVASAVLVRRSVSSGFADVLLGAFVRTILGGLPTRRKLRSATLADVPVWSVADAGFLTLVANFSTRAAPSFFYGVNKALPASPACCFSGTNELDLYFYNS